MNVESRGQVEGHIEGKQKGEENNKECEDRLIMNNKEGKKEERGKRNREIDMEEELPRTMLPTPPDGGWGWVVVFASFMIHVLADGFTYTFGIFYVHILNYYGVSKASASWIASILVGVTLGSGPISGTLVNRFGCRIVTIAGAILASVALFLSIYAQTVEVLYLTIGCGAGLGFGLIYLPAIVCVTGYFEQRRSFATGIAVCGSGIGTFAFSPMVEHLIEVYSWKGALFILSGIMLNCVFFGALFRPLEFNFDSIEDLEFSSQTQPNGGQYLLGGDAFPEGEGLGLEDIPKIEISCDDIDPKSRKISDNQLQLQITSTGNANPSGKSSAEFQRIGSHGCINPRLQLLKNADTTRMSASQPLLGGTPPSSSSFHEHPLGATSSKRSLPTTHSGSGLLYRSDIFYRGSLLNIPEYKHNPKQYRELISRFPDAEETQSEKDRAKICGCVPCSRETRDAMHRLVDWGLLSDGIFLLFALSNFCTSIGFNAPYIFIVDRALEIGIGFEKASYLLAVVGIANTVSRVALGYISDKTWVNRLYLYNTALTICGVGTCVSIWFSNFASQAFYAALFGATSGAYVGLTSVVLVDLLGIEKLTNAFGLLLMFQGIASLIGPPICGALYDMSKNYDYSFLLAGFMIGISGLMLFLIPCIYRAQDKKKEKNQR